MHGVTHCCTSTGLAGNVKRDLLGDAGFHRIITPKIHTQPRASTELCFTLLDLGLCVCIAGDPRARDASIITIKAVGLC